MIGGYFDACTVRWSEAEMDWYEAFLEEQDVDIMAWAIGVQPVPARWQGPMMDGLRKLDYIQVAK